MTKLLSFAIRATTARRLSYVLAAVAALVSAAAPAARAESPATYMQRVQNELLAAQRSGSGTAFANVLRKHMDVPSIGLTALGEHARTLPKTERPAYFNGMIRFISNYAAKEAPKYPVASAVVTGQGEETIGGATVNFTGGQGGNAGSLWIGVGNRAVQAFAAQQQVVHVELADQLAGATQLDVAEAACRRISSQK